MAIIVSILALIATFFQAYLQRVHNQKSVKPLGQIDFRDLNGHLFVAVTNNGVGPLIIEQAEYLKADKSHTKLNDLLHIDIKMYDNVVVANGVVKVVYPGTQLRLFEITFEQLGSEVTIDQTRADLSLLTLKISAKDIYDNKIELARSLEWFNRHSTR